MLADMLGFYPVQEYKSIVAERRWLHRNRLRQRGCRNEASSVSGFEYYAVHKVPASARFGVCLSFYEYCVKKSAADHLRVGIAVQSKQVHREASVAGTVIVEEPVN